jgi:ribosome recycling factor
MINDIKNDAEQRMKQSIDALHRGLNSLRTGRASPALVERLTVDYYGTQTPLNQVAGVSVPESRLLVIQPWDKGALPAIERAIQMSELGLTPNNDGQVIRLTIPQLTEERRKSLVKVLRSKVEEGKVSVRNVRRDAMDSIKDLLKEKSIGEDEERRAEAEIQDLTNRFIEEADVLGQAKEEEILEV